MHNCKMWYHIHKLCAGKDYLKRHVLNKNEDKKILCDQCSFECGTDQSLCRHNYDLKTPSRIELFCRYCQKTFIDKAHLHGHMKCHNYGQSTLQMFKCAKKPLVTNLRC